MPIFSLLTKRPTPTADDYVGGYSPSISTDVLIKLADMRSIFATKRVTSTVTTGDPVPNADTDDVFILTGLSTAANMGAPTGSPANGQPLTIRIKDNGTARALTWNAIYRGIGVTLPTTTTATKVLYVGMMYNSDDSAWDVIAVGRQA